MPSTINADNGVVSGSSGVKTTADTSGVLALQSNGSTGVTLDTSLNVGIGTASPSASFKLDVTGLVRSNATANGGGQFTIAKSGTTVGGLCGSGNWIGSSATDLALFAETGNSLIFYTNGSATGKFQIGTSGQLGVGGANYGNSGQVLTSGGSGAAPTWTTPSAGAVSLISTATASSSASIAFTGLTTTYAYYYVEYDSLVASSAGPSFLMYVSSDNGSTYKGSFQYKWTNFYVGMSSFARASQNTGNEFYIAAAGNGMGTADDGAYGSGIVYIYSPAANSCTFTWQTMNRNSTTLDTQFGAGGLVTNGLAAINAIKFQAESGATISGNFRLYGVAKT